jgi:hypothetical protein
MKTPWGELEGLDLSDKKLAERILTADKHQLVEGMIVECLYDQILDSLPEHVPDVIALDVETVIAQAKKWGDRKIAVVWARDKKNGLGRYLTALEKRFRVFLVEYETGKGFFGTAIKDGKRSGSVMSIEDLLKPIAAVAYKPFAVSEAVRDEERQREAIYGFLFSHHGGKLASNVLLPRILINCGVQPWFRFVWNLDKIFIIDGKPWLFEVKHKFPYRDQQSSVLKFGLNDGEVAIFRLLSECGIGCIFSIMVKPKWSKDVGSLYILTDLKARKNTAVIGKVLDSVTIEKLDGKASGISGSDTTITGDAGGKLKFKRIPVADFGMFGRFSDEPSSIAERIVSEIRGTKAARATDDGLASLRMPI